MIETLMEPLVSWATRAGPPNWVYLTTALGFGFTRPAGWSGIVWGIVENYLPSREAKTESA